MTGSARVRAARGGPAADAVHVGAEAVADAVGVPQRLRAAGLGDELLGAVHVLGGEPAEPVDAFGPVEVHPAVRGQDARVGRGLEEVEDAVGGLDAHVVDLEHHVALHHAAHGVLAQPGQPAHVALCVRVVRGDLHARGEALLGRGGGGETDGVVVLRAGAALGPPEGAGGQELSGIDGGAERPGVETHAAQRVVELVAQEHAAHTQVVQLVEARVDVLTAALGDVQDHLAAERLRRLHAQHHGESALLDHLTRLRAVGDDTEPSLPGPPYIAST